MPDAGVHECVCAALNDGKTLSKVVQFNAGEKTSSPGTGENEKENERGGNCM